MRLSITLVLAMLRLATLLWARVDNTPTVAAPPAAQEAAWVINGSVVTIGVAVDLSPSEISSIG